MPPVSLVGSASRCSLPKSGVASARIIGSSPRCWKASRTTTPIALRPRPMTSPSDRRRSARPPDQPDLGETAMADLFAVAAQEAQGRRRQMLRTAFGPAIAAALADPHVVEVMLNPDGCLWLDKLGAGRVDTGERIEPAEAERIVRLVAAHVRREVHEAAPIVSAELPGSGERFEGLVPPIVTAPCFAIRKPAEVLYRLSDYVSAGILSPRQRAALETAVRERKNILVAGGTSSGKTTLLNALLAEVAGQNERVV